MKTKKSAYCLLNCTPVREIPSDQSEMVTQLQFGEVVDWLDQQDSWVFVRSFTDHYEGWVDQKSIKKLTDKEVSRWLDGQSILFSDLCYVVGPNGKQLLTKGAFITYGEKESFTIGNDTYELINEPTFYHELDFTKVAKGYLNTPYLWGGKSLLGIDCSGFTQMVYRFCDINIPRDASQQIENGYEVEFDDQQIGDLAFFENKEGKITHVGLILENQQIIHASGRVRIDQLKIDGIFAEEYESTTHKLHSIRRML